MDPMRPTGTPTQYVTTFIRGFWLNDIISDDWKEGIFIKILKKRNLTLYKNVEA